jgi:GH24 family phage-related lysozyme (muramidase)
MGWLLPRLGDGGLSAWMKKRLFQFQEPEAQGMMDYLIPLNKHFESFSPVWYRCTSGVRTIGYGHTGQSHDLLPAPWTEDYAAKVMAGELELNYIPATIEALTDRGIDWKTLQPYEQAALVSFGYNAGTESIRKATFVGKIAAGAPAHDIERAWWLWNRSNGAVSPGLVRRRFCCSKLFLTGKLDFQPAGWREYYEAHK